MQYLMRDIINILHSLLLLLLLQKQQQKWK